MAKLSRACRQERWLRQLFPDAGSPCLLILSDLVEYEFTPLLK